MILRKDLNSVSAGLTTLLLRGTNTAERMMKQLKREKLKVSMNSIQYNMFLLFISIVVVFTFMLETSAQERLPPMEISDIGIIKVGSDTVCYNEDCIMTFHSFTNGNVHIIEVFYANGSISERDFIDKSKLHFVLSQEFYCSGEVYSVTNYQKGKRHGNKVYFDLNGNPLMIKRYKKGKLKSLFYNGDYGKYLELQNNFGNCSKSQSINSNFKLNLQGWGE